MVTKLTLSADEEIVKRAKRLAKEQGTSVSALFERFVRGATEEPKKRKIGPLTRKATGLAKLPKGKSDREILEEALMEKYGL
jgi:Family of unknown function (DUF6364)